MAPVGCVDFGGDLHSILGDACLDGSDDCLSVDVEKSLSSLHGTDTGYFKSDRSFPLCCWSFLSAPSLSSPPSCPTHGWMFIVQWPPQQKKKMHLYMPQLYMIRYHVIDTYVSMSVILCWKETLSLVDYREIGQLIPPHPQFWKSGSVWWQHEENICGGGGGGKHMWRRALTFCLHLDCDTLAFFSHGTKRRHVRVSQFMDVET